MTKMVVEQNIVELIACITSISSFTQYTQKRHNGFNTALSDSNLDLRRRVSCHQGPFERRLAPDQIARVLQVLVGTEEQRLCQGSFRRDRYRQMDVH